MARLGYLLGDLLVGGFELVGGHIAKGAVQPSAVEPGDVVHGRVAGGGAGGPGLLVEALAFRDAKNDSASALSQHCPVRPLDKVTVRSAASLA